MKANEPTLLETSDEPSTELVPAPAVSMFERLASDPNVDVEKLQRLIEMQERIMRHNAKSAFDSSYSRMQPAIPEIDERGQILVKGQLRSRYAKLEDIQKVVKPILREHGFALRHRTEWPAEKPGIIRIVGILTHCEGHAEESVFEAKADASDYRTDIQSQGSTVSYGRRYTTIDLLNISTRGLDDDGQKSGAPQAPDGYDEWMLKLSEAANKNLQALETAFAAGDQKLRNYLTNHDALNLAKMRTRARTGKAATS